MFERKISKNGIELQPDPTDAANIVVASVSGGKDSTAMSLWLTEQGIEHRRVCMDTGWEHPDWRPYVEDYLQERLGPIEIIQAERGGMVEHIKHKGIFPSRLRRWCTEELKIIPFQKKMKQIRDETGREPISCIGVRAQESRARANLPQWDIVPRLGFFLWRPLISWTVEDVIKIHQQHNVRPNPLYLRGEGVDRVGCWPCIHSRKAEIKMVAKQTPERIDEIRLLEAEITASAQATADAKGEPLRHKRTFFQKLGSVGREVPGTYSVPIDKAVQWSRTSYGGKQFEMFASEREGCVRWGMCEGVGSPAWTQGDDDEGLK